MSRPLTLFRVLLLLGLLRAERRRSETHAHIGSVPSVAVTTISKDPHRPVESEMLDDLLWRDV